MNININNNKIEELELEKKLCYEKIQILQKELDNYKEILTCKVCNEVSKNVKFVQTKCNHVFCAKCAKTALESEEKLCPICDIKLEKGTLFKIKIK